MCSALQSHLVPTECGQGLMVVNLLKNKFQKPGNNYVMNKRMTPWTWHCSYWVVARKMRKRSPWCCFFIFVWVCNVVWCVCVCMCTRVHAHTHACTHTHVPWHVCGQRAASGVHLHLPCCLRQGLCSPLCAPGLLTHKLLDSPASVSHFSVEELGLLQLHITVFGFWCGFWESALRSSCCIQQMLYPQAIFLASVSVFTSYVLERN